MRIQTFSRQNIRAAAGSRTDTALWNLLPAPVSSRRNWPRRISFFSCPAPRKRQRGQAGLKSGVRRSWPRFSPIASACSGSSSDSGAAWQEARFRRSTGSSSAPGRRCRLVRHPPGCADCFPHPGSPIQGLRFSAHSAQLIEWCALADSRIHACNLLSALLASAFRPEACRREHFDFRTTPSTGCSLPNLATMIVSARSSRSSAPADSPSWMSASARPMRASSRNGWPSPQRASTIRRLCSYQRAASRAFPWCRRTRARRS